MTLVRFGIFILLVVVVAACSQLPNPTDATLEAQITESGKLTASDALGFGGSVAIDGDWMVVGASETRGPTGNYGQGAAYVYQKDETGGWQFVKKLAASNVTAFDYDHFGESVAINGDTIVIGAQGDEDYNGAAYIFERDQGGLNQWGKVKKLVHDDVGVIANFGSAVAISGDTIIVGVATVQRVSLFKRNAGGLNNWGRVRTFGASDAANGDSFGVSLAISGNTVVVGAYEDDVGANRRQGSAYLFARDQGGPNAWGEVKKLIASDGAKYDYFGWSVAISGSMVVIGAPAFRGGTNNNGGSAYLFERNQGGTNTWGEVKKFLARDRGRTDRFGFSVAIRDSTVVVGAPINKTIYGRGSAYLFQRNYGGLNTWGQFRRLVASDGRLNTYLGASVAVSSDTVFVGATYNSDQGALYLFDD
jgi:FG-GAP repeat